MPYLIKKGYINGLIACERSGKVRDSFKSEFFNIWSCDLKQSSRKGNHYKGDVFDILYQGWDFMICFPPCTYLSNFGNKFIFDDGRILKKAKALLFASQLWESGIKYICLENPVGALNTFMPVKPQTIHPYHPGDYYLKCTCLWLKNLPPLVYTLNDTLFDSGTSANYPKPEWISYNGKNRYWMDRLNKTPDRSNIKSETFLHVALAMADQWTPYLLKQFGIT